MNKKQKAVVLIGIVVIISMALVPPWKAILDIDGPGGTHSERALKYRYFRDRISVANNIHALEKLFSGPYKNAPLRSFSYTITYDYTRLAFQWALILFLTAGFLLFFSEKDKTVEEGIRALCPGRKKSRENG